MKGIERSNTLRANCSGVDLSRSIDLNAHLFCFMVLEIAAGHAAKQEEIP